MGPVPNVDERLADGGQRGGIARTGGGLPHRHEREHAESGDEQHCALNHPRRHEADCGALVLALHDREESHRRADAGHAGAEVEEHPPEDLAVVPGGEHRARVRQHRGIQEGGRDPGDERREIQQARDERGSSQWSHDDVLVRASALSLRAGRGASFGGKGAVCCRARPATSRFGGRRSLLFWLIVPTITAPVSTNVINPASTAASSGSTEVSACPLTVLAKGRESAPERACSFRTHRHRWRCPLRYIGRRTRAAGRCRCHGSAPGCRAQRGRAGT